MKASTCHGWVSACRNQEKGEWFLEAKTWGKGLWCQQSPGPEMMGHKGAGAGGCPVLVLRYKPSSPRQRQCMLGFGEALLARKEAASEASADPPPRQLPLQEATEFGSHSCNHGRGAGTSPMSQEGWHQWLGAAAGRKVPAEASTGFMQNFTIHSTPARPENVQELLLAERRAQAPSLCTSSCRHIPHWDL